MNVLLIQPPWPRPSKLKSPSKYWPFPLIKLAALYRKQGHNVALIVDDPVKYDQGGLFSCSESPFPGVDRLVFTTVFSYWFPYVKKCIEQYQAKYPSAEIHIGGVHATFSPEVYRQHFPRAYVHVGPVPEAEVLEPAWDMLPGHVKTQILRFSQGCKRRCSFCGNWRFEPYKAYSWESVAPKIKMNTLILNDNNFLFHPECRQILRNLAEHKVNGKPITSVEIQGGFDARILAKNKDIIPLMKAARIQDIRLAWDGGLEQAPAVESSLEALVAAGYSMRNLRCYCLYNHDLPFDLIAQKLEYFAKWKLGPVHSRYRPIEILHDGYIKQKRSQKPGEYYLAPGWSDKQIRVIGSIASDISRMARAGKDSLDEVREYYGRPTVAQTMSTVIAT